MRKMIVLLALLCVAGALFAQSTVMVNTPKGLFALREGVLARINTTTLKVEKEMQLFGPMPAAPAEGADQATRQAYNAEVMKRQAPAILLVKDASVLVLVGDQFARVNQETFKVESYADLKAPDAVTDGNNGFRFTRQEAPGYLLVGDVLFLLRTKEIMAITILDGKFTRNALPADMQPLQFNYNRGGGNPGGGGNGNRN